MSGGVRYATEARARRLAPWLALFFFGCAAGLGEEQTDDTPFVEEVIDDSAMLELALQQDGPRADEVEPPQGDDKAAAELARMLQARLDSTRATSTSDTQVIVEDQIVSELEATLDRSIELAQQLLDEDASVPRGDGSDSPAADADAPR